MPVDRMPFEMIEHSINFFNADDIKQVRAIFFLLWMLLIIEAIWPIQIKCPSDYLQWQTSMYCLFGTKWSKLHHGPMWSVVPTGQTQTVASLGVLNPLQVGSFIYIGKLQSYPVYMHACSTHVCRHKLFLVTYRRMSTSPGLVSPQFGGKSKRWILQQILRYRYI